MRRKVSIPKPTSDEAIPVPAKRPKLARHIVNGANPARKGDHPESLEASSDRGKSRSTRGVVDKGLEDAEPPPSDSEGVDLEQRRKRSIAELKSEM